MPRDRTTDGSLVVYGVNPVLELLRRGAPVGRLLLGPGPRRDEVAAAARTRGIPTTGCDRRTLDQAAGGPHHQGVVVEAPPFRYAPLPTLLGPDTRTLLVLDGVQDPRNLGAILRTARAAGVGGVVLPQDRSVGVTSVVALTAAGLLFDLPIARVPNLVRAMEAVKEAGFWLVGLTTRGGDDLTTFRAPPRPVLVVGGEGEGLRPLVERTCDFRVSIPMADGVESLNVAVAAGIAVFQLLRQA
jgi:23S rRNA (guanosine2251-2'-O)-methyltransferase